MSNELTELIRSARKRSGLTQKELAKSISVTQSAVAMWETGKRQPSLADLDRICGVLRIDPKEVLGGLFPSLDSSRAQRALDYYHNLGDPAAMAKMTVEQVEEQFLRRDRENGVYPVDRPTRVMPVVGFAHAGAPTISDEMIEEQFPVREVDWHRTARLTRILGDCMAPTLREGDYAGIAICDPKELRPYTDIVVVVLEDEETVCRWWGGRDAGPHGPWMWTLVPENVPEYPVLQVRERDSRLVGKVAWSHREW